MAEKNAINMLRSRALAALPRVWSGCVQGRRNSVSRVQHVSSSLLVAPPCSALCVREQCETRCVREGGQAPAAPAVRHSAMAGDSPRVARRRPEEEKRGEGGGKGKRRRGKRERRSRASARDSRAHAF